MPGHALVIGGSRFVGRHTVTEFLEAGYEVTVFNRGVHDDPFANCDGVDRVEGDRTNDPDLRRAGLDVDPDVVIDCVAYYPRDVHTATDVFETADAYVYVSSAAAYRAETVPKREAETGLEPCSADEAIDDTRTTYGKRKAEGDRAVFEAADRGIDAMAVRPPVVYGPHDYTGRFDYWIDRVENHDRVVVPGDGTVLRHLAYVKDVASAVRTVAEAGTPGVAYNVGDDHAPVLGEWIDLLADACDAAVDIVFASGRELGTVGLETNGFPLYRDYPLLLDTSTLRSLGWESTPHRAALAETVAAHCDSDRTGRENGPDRETEERLLDVLETIE